MCSATFKNGLNPPRGRIPELVAFNDFHAERTLRADGREEDGLKTQIKGLKIEGQSSTNGRSLLAHARFSFLYLSLLTCK